jgi:RNA polymerase sigma-70 factor (ECF subfamily)
MLAAESQETSAMEQRQRTGGRQGYAAGWKARGSQVSAVTIEGMDPDDAPLIRSIADGDEAAFDRIFALHSKKVFHIAYRLLGNRDEAEDAVQEVFLTVFQKANTFRGQAQFSTWLYRLAVNAALSRLRREKRRKEISYEEFLPQFQTDGHHKTRPVVDWSSEVDHRSGNEELKQLLRNAFDQLKPMDKAVVVLSDVEGFSDQDIARSLKLTVSAVKTRLHRARLFLRGRLAVHLGYSAA